MCGNSSFANKYRQGCRGNIVGGNDAAPGSYPWHALLKLDGRGVCGASLLNELWLITGKYMNWSFHAKITIMILTSNSL